MFHQVYKFFIEIFGRRPKGRTDGRHTYQEIKKITFGTLFSSQLKTVRLGLNKVVLSSFLIKNKLYE